MPDPPRELEQLQRWLQATISHPGGVEHGAAAASDNTAELASSSIDEVVLPSSTLTASQRLAVYSHAYTARLGECLVSEFPVVHQAIGEELFAEFAVAYLYQHPSQSYTLAKLGEKFPQFLADCRPDDEDESSPWPDFLIDLARLEWTINEVFHAPGTENLPPLASDALAHVGPDQWEQVKFEPAECLRLLEFDWSINAYYTALRLGQEASPPPRRTTYLAVIRRDYRVVRYEMSRTAYTVLSALVAGESVGIAIQGAADLGEVSLEELAGSLQKWFADWTRDRFFIKTLH